MFLNAKSIFGILVILTLLMTSCSTELTASPSATDVKPTASATEPSPTALPLPDLGPAPDFTNEVWLNTDQPFTLERLRGKVVLVEFWTFG